MRTGRGSMGFTGPSVADGDATERVLDGTARDRLAWMREAGLGTFIHWGLYSLPARHEWVKYRERMNDADTDVIDPARRAITLTPGGVGGNVLTLDLLVQPPDVDVPVVELFLT
jgi:Alpha-L-fucosidase